MVACQNCGCPCHRPAVDVAGDPVKADWLNPLNLPAEPFAGVLAGRRVPRAWLRERLITRAVAKSGKDRAAVEKAVDAALAESEGEPRDRPFLDWLVNGGFEKILALVLKLLPLFL